MKTVENVENEKINFSVQKSCVRDARKKCSSGVFNVLSVYSVIDFSPSPPNFLTDLLQDELDAAKATEPQTQIPTKLLSLIISCSFPGFQLFECAIIAGSMSRFIGLFSNFCEYQPLDCVFT